MASEADVERALDRFGGRLEKLKNVVGLGNTPAGAGEDEWQLVVYVAEKVRDDELEPEDRVPRSLQVREGGREITVPTDVVEIGPVRLE
jgi:hypothetical protein